MRYPLAFFVDSRYINSKFAAQTYGPLVLIDRKYREDRGLYVHELVHVKQWAVTAAIVWAVAAVILTLLALPSVIQTASILAVSAYGLLYAGVRPFRLWAEILCYRAQLKEYQRQGTGAPMLESKARRFAEFIRDKYNHAARGRTLDWIVSQLI